MHTRCARSLSWIVCAATLLLAAGPEGLGAWTAPAIAEAAAAPCPAGSTARLQIDNQCEDAVWAVITAPGTPAQVHVAAQWSWVEPYLTNRNFIDTGATGKIKGTALDKLVLGSPAPNPALVKGMTIRVTGAGPAGADLTSTITSVTVASDAVTRVHLDTSASTPVKGAAVWYYTRQGAFKIEKGDSPFVCVPDKGAPSGNFRFFMGCPTLASDTDPFGPAGCVIGSGVGDLSNVNTLFEPSFGCESPLSGPQCAFNPSDASAACQSNPSASNCGPLSATDYYDISAVDGYTLPMRVDAAGTSCTAPSKDASMLDLASCPSEGADTLLSNNAARQAVIAGGVSLLTTTTQGSETYLQACAAPHVWFQTTSLGSPPNPSLATPSCTGSLCNAVNYYAGTGCSTSACTPCTGSACNPSACTSCPGGSGPQQKVGPLGTGQYAIQNTSYVQSVRALGYRGYTWQYDDGVGAQTCDAGASLKVTLCPAGANTKPYRANTLWTFSEATGTCAPDGTGTPNHTTTFGSLFACQTAMMQYTCTNLTSTDPFGLPIAIWAADPAATITPTEGSRTYAEFTAKQKLHCEQFTVPTQGFPSDGQIDVTNCTYYFKHKTVGDKEKLRLCPKS